MKKTSHQTRHGFTLVEILAAILIISILAGLFFVAGRAAISFFRGVNDKADLDNVAKALELYKNKYGEYPPDGTADEGTIKRHLNKRDPNLLKQKKLQDKLDEVNLLAPEQFLAYWLCGPNWVGPNATQTGESEFIELKPGFSKKSDVGTTRAGINFNIAEGTLCNTKGYPILYFRAMKNVQTGETGYNEGVETAGGKPYAKKEGGWFCPDSYQLILPGEDGDFSTSADNVTNFAAGATMAEEDYDGK